MGRYHWTSLRDHPLQPEHEWKRVGTHRIVLWEKIGPGTHPCHWCAAPVAWTVGGYTRPGSLTTDHLDNDGRNNDPANLVPSCHPCNTQRHAHLAIGPGEVSVKVPGYAGRRRAEERRCERCGAAFLFVVADKRPSRGRFCSRPCARSGPRR